MIMSYSSMKIINGKSFNQVQADLNSYTISDQTIEDDLISVGYLFLDIKNRRSYRIIQGWSTTISNALERL